MPRASEHVVQFYETDSFLVDAVAAYIGTGLRADESGIVVATAAHLCGVEARLRTSGLDVAGASAGGRLVTLDAGETFSRFMDGEMPDPARFRETIGGLLAGATAGGRRARVFGEMVAVLAGEGDYAGALRLEELWNDLQQTHRFRLFCAYPLTQLSGEALTTVLGEVCATHTRVIPAESYLSLTSVDQRRRAVALLQQKARTLEAEIAVRKRLEERLRLTLAAERAARQEAETALRQRDEFLSIASHELKTPITSLIGHAQVAIHRIVREGRAEPEPVMRTLRIIAEQSGKLTRLLSRLLDISHLDAGNLVLDRLHVDLAALVESVAAEARSRSDQHRIVADLPPVLEAEVDALRLEQVLTNLLDNAIKYSPDGGAIEVTLTRVGSHAAELSVRDHGLGIPPEKRGRIFERFYQAHATGHRSGMGLGLYICRHIVEQHGGTIWAEFPVDGGTRFTLRLPLAGEAPVQLSPRASGTDHEHVPASFAVGN